MKEERGRDISHKKTQIPAGQEQEETIFRLSLSVSSGLLKRKFHQHLADKKWVSVVSLSSLEGKNRLILNGRLSSFQRRR